MLQIISLGMGVQSTALYLMSSLKELPRADYAIFADTGKEGSGTYRYLSFLQEWRERNNGIPLIVLKEKNLFEDLLSRKNSQFAPIPAFTENGDGSVGMLRRQCTGEYKIAVTDRYVRDVIYGLPRYARRPATHVWHGITLDEIERMAIPSEAWKINTYPFIGHCVNYKEQQRLPWAKPMNRSDVINWYLLHGLEIPPKSSCVFCPYQSDHAWAVCKREQPEDFAAAVRVDEAIRHNSQRGIQQPVYLHRSCRPLANAIFDDAKEEPWGECSGCCHV
ncbi:hypothetical protein [Dinghuibacter silviterrae]|uniref:3'-phosphoadenosine 5'-phosphosulfate sulfotransferase (PAPS reductase)/FAD synthetase n=1 Tax=Dinghuibacter silviterrae TaxID=1539049 RepID=A0A4R8DSX6_9BACT|nr:hypothetical protein [Dinghuibacter silviterrae]TDX00507.1 hypothetical protein EDB95_1532 [Dinghuibacter silviterrae]